MTVEDTLWFLLGVLAGIGVSGLAGLLVLYWAYRYEKVKAKNW